MFKRKNRVPRGTKFNNADLFSTSLFNLKIKKNKLLFNRFAVVVSKRLDKRAVFRNRTKRLVRGVMGDLDKDMKKGYDMLLITKKEILGKSEEEARRVLETILKKRNYLQ